VNTRSSVRIFEIPERLKGNWKNSLTGEALSLSKTVDLEGYEYWILQRE